MRLVYAQEECKDRTEGQRTLRKLLKESPKEFIQQLAKLEEAHARRGAKAAPLLGEEERDEGTEKVKDLLAEEWKRAELFFEVWEASSQECCQPGCCKWAQIQEEARARGVAVPEREVR
jgi:hypothetical protein